MEQLKEQMVARENYLIHLKKEKEKALKTAPEGNLRICSHGNRTQYYKREDSKDFNGVYIRDSDVKLARKLAQKEYDKKVLFSVEKELQAIKKYFSNIPATSPEQIYESLHRARKKLVVPIKQPLEEYVQEWENVSYQGKVFEEGVPQMYTAKGERVRSKSEVIIADSLYREGISYRYEYPLHLKNGTVFYPDFTVLKTDTREEIYWEHMGMMDDAEYVEGAIYKLMVYEQNGIFSGKNLILTYETKKYPMNQRRIKGCIRQYL